MKIEGITYLLVRSSHAPHVARYTDGEMKELFTDEQRELLERGLSIFMNNRAGVSQYTDMVVAAMSVAQK